MSRCPREFLNDELSGRAAALNDAPVDSGGKYVLVWLQQTLRGDDHPTIDAGVQIANGLGIPALVYHGLREDYPHASARLHGFMASLSAQAAKWAEHFANAELPVCSMLSARPRR